MASVWWLPRAQWYCLELSVSGELLLKANCCSAQPEQWGFGHYLVLIVFPLNTTCRKAESSATPKEKIMKKNLLLKPSDSIFYSRNQFRCIYFWWHFFQEMENMLNWSFQNSCIVAFTSALMNGWSSQGRDTFGPVCCLVYWSAKVGKHDHPDFHEIWWKLAWAKKERFKLWSGRPTDNSILLCLTHSGFTQILWLCWKNTLWNESQKVWRSTVWKGKHNWCFVSYWLHSLTYIAVMCWAWAENNIL